MPLFHYAIGKHNTGTENKKILFEAMKEALESMEPQKCEEIINDFNAYLLDDALKDTLAKINSFVDEYDFDEALGLIDAWEAVN